MTAPNVQVRFSAEDKATEVARKLLEVLRQLQNEQKAAAAAAGTLAAPTKAAADGFDRMSKSVIGLRANTSGLDAISKRVALLGQGLQSASTRAASLTKLQAAEAQLQKALQQSNLTLEQRIRLERELATVQSTINGPANLDVPQGALGRFQQLHGVLSSIAVAIGAIRLLGLAKDAIDAADALNDLAKRTGVSVETLSVLSQEAKKAGADTESLATGFRQLSKSVEELRSGSTAAEASFRAIGLSAKDLKGLSLDQVLIRVANAMAKFEDGSGKSAVATQIFGRAGEQLIPLLESLANGGFDRAAEKAKALGGVLHGDAAQAADDFNDSLVTLRTSLSGFTNQLAGPLQGLTDLINKVAEFLAKIPAPLKAFVVGAGVAGAAALVLAGSIGALVFALGALAEVTGVGVIAALIGGITGLGAAAASSSALVKQLGGDLAALDRDDKLAALVATNPTGQKKGTITIPDPAAEKAARAAHLAQIKQAAQDELAATRAGLAETEEIENERFAQRLTSITGFFRARTNIVEQGIAAELKAQNQQLTQLKAAPLAENTEAARIQRETEIQSLEQSIARTKVEGETRVLALVEQERVARKSAETEFTSFIAQIATAQGQTLQATQIQIEQSAERFREVLSNLGVDDTQSEALVGRLVTLLTDRAVITDQTAKFERELNTLARERVTIEQAVANGTLSEREGVAAVTEAERQHKATLQETVTLVRQYAQQLANLGDPTLLDAVDQMQQHIDAMGQSVAASTKLAREFKTNLLDAAQADVADFLGSTINEVNSLGAAFQKLASSIVGSFQRIAAQIIAAKIFEKIGDLLGIGVNSGAAALAKAGVEVQKGGGLVLLAAGALAAAARQLQIAAAADVGISAARGILTLASGGHVSGPGTGTSDSIPARLSAGEFVQPARTVEHYGVRFMESLRAMRVPKAALANAVAGRSAVVTHPVQLIVPVLVERHEGGQHRSRVSVVRHESLALVSRVVQSIRDRLLERQQSREVVAARSDTSRDRMGLSTREIVRTATAQLIHNLVEVRETFARDSIHRLRELSETINLARQQHQLTDGSGAADEARKERHGVSRTDRETLRGISHEHGSLISRVVEIARATSRGREERLERVREVSMSTGDGSGQARVSHVLQSAAKTAQRLASFTRSESREALRETARDGHRVEHSDQFTRTQTTRIDSTRLVQQIRELAHFGSLLRVERTEPERIAGGSEVVHERDLHSSSTHFVSALHDSIVRITDALRDAVNERVISREIATSVTAWMRDVTRAVTSQMPSLPVLRVAGATLALAGGGYVRGPGTATSDSIPARLSNQEFVQPARATAYYGVSVMEAIRTLRIPRELLLEFTAGLHTPRVTSIDSIGLPQFAEGGLVTIEQRQQAAAASQPTAAPPAAFNGTLRIQVESDEDHIVRVLESSKGLKAQVKNVQKNKGMFRAVSS